jgi:hypothetical protein
VRVHFDIEVFDGPADVAPGRAKAFRDYTVEVVASGAPLVTFVDDEALRKQIASLLNVAVMSQRGGFSAGVSITAKGGAEQPNVSVALEKAGGRVGGAWSMFIEADGVRLPVGKFKIGWRSKTDLFQASAWMSTPKLPAGATQCRLILVPDERYAAEREAIDLMPAGEIVFEDVAIR